MKIDRIQVGAFGRLESFDSGPDSLGGLVIVLGPNEAGKSTLFSFLTTALYGFHPATRERNPLVPWGADQATGSVRVQLDSTSCAAIERTLRSQPVGRLTLGGRTTELRNQPVPWVSHVPRTVFRQVFAITLQELAGLDEETWGRIQDKMIGSMGATDLNSARSVADVLEREAGEIWRPNRRGNQRLRHLQGKLRDLRGRRAQALDRDARIRRLVEERDALRDELQALREQRQVDRAEVEQSQSLLPIRRQLQRIATLRADGGEYDELRGLPPDPVARLSELEAELTELEREERGLESEIDDWESVVARARDSRPLLQHREHIIQLAARATGSEHDRAKAVELENEIGEVEARLEAAAAPVLTGPWREVPGSVLGSVEVELIRERISMTRGPESGGRSTEPVHEPMLWGSLAAGAALLAWGLIAGQTLISALGAAALAVGVTRWSSSRRTGQGPAKEAPAADGVGELLRGLPVRPELLDRPGEALVSGLARLRDLSRQHEELTRALEANEERREEVQAGANDLVRSLGLPVSVDAVSTARDLDRQLRDAERLCDSAADAERRLVRLRRDHQEVRTRVAQVAAETEELSIRARAFVPGAPRMGLTEAGNRLAAHERAEQLEDELSRTHPDLDELRARIEALDRRGHGWSLDGEALARVRARIEEHDERIEDLLARGEALDAEVGHLRHLDTVDAVDSEVASLREEEARVMRERDRKWVLARLLREADRRFRDEHQPDLVQRAGTYLRHLTGGRYERLIVDETDGDALFHLIGPDLPAPVPLAPPVSTGTIEQAYLSLRLAIVDHLDQGGERLPLFVDEILVNWDRERRARGVEVLDRIAGSRQVFVFTCHGSVAAELEERGGRVLELPGR
jgi:uncharacterized protein YhaN